MTLRATLWKTAYISKKYARYFRGLWDFQDPELLVVQQLLVVNIGLEYLSNIGLE